MKAEPYKALFIIPQYKRFSKKHSKTTFIIILCVHKQPWCVRFVIAPIV